MDLNQCGAEKDFLSLSVQAGLNISLNITIVNSYLRTEECLVNHITFSFTELLTVFK